MPAADDGTKKAEEEDVIENGGTQQVANMTVKEQDATKEIQQQPKVEPPEADEFGLPVKPPRRRQWPKDEGDEQASVNGEEERKHESNPNDGDINGKTAEDSKPATPKPGDDAETETNRPRAATLDDIADRPRESQEKQSNSRPSSSHHQKQKSSAAGGISEWSHQQLAPHDVEEDEEGKEGEWQAMPAFATHRIYDDWGKVLAQSHDEVDGENLGYSNLGGAGKGYTRVQIDEDAQSATSMDDNTAYLFKEPHSSNALDEDEEGRDVVSQMQATKEFLTEAQRIAYVGVVRLSIGKMLDELSHLEKSKNVRKQIEFATESMKMWGQKMMVRLYGHMEISSAEQMMVEQLAEHGVLPSDLTPALMQNARIKNPAKLESETSSINSARPSIHSPRPSNTFEKLQSAQNLSAPPTPGLPPESPPPPPAYEEHTADELTVQDPKQIQNQKDLDIDLRWTVLCDLFLLLLADSAYDARSRTLLEHVGSALSVDWQEICRFEKRVTDALEMQEDAEKENWDEEEHLEARRKAGRNKRLMVMGLCTVGGGLVIGLSAGLLAPVIGAGLAAGFTTIGVAGTSTFLGGAGAAALIGGAGSVTGGIIGVKASSRRTGAVKTFEYRPLFNNKRANLIVTVSGWMTGKVDDVRLPFSTVDAIVGDIYSIHWEPEMLQSTGQTIQILATEALTQTIQQILGATILTTLMAGLSLPIVLTKLAYLIDNPWTVSLARADSTGLILADSLIDRNLGTRPITLVGFSLGSRVIFSCLKELARRGAIGLVQNVYLFGSPIVAKKEDYTRARTVVSGRFVNGYATNDWILGYLFRATSGGIMRVSGLASVDVPGIENKDFTDLVPGHMAYRGMMPILLSEVGWSMDALEFSEIEDPDPENHEKRQRELINEIEAARTELDERQTQKKSGFIAFFSRKKAPEKKDWETYDERSQQKVFEGDEKEAERFAAEESANVMFDVDAIKQEAMKLALQGEDVEDIKKHLQIKELESTLPALKIDSSFGTNTGSDAPNGSTLRQTKSLDESAAKFQPTTQESTMPNGVIISSVEDNENTAQEALPNEPTIHEPPSPAPSPKPSSSQGLSSEKQERPPLKTAATAPQWSTPHSENKRKVSSSDPEIKSPDHNPWANEEEAEFGKEQDVQMSFE